MIGDTSFFIDLIREKPEALQKLQEIIDSEEEFKITTPTIFELFTGAFLSKKETEYGKLKEIVQEFNIIEFDMTAADEAARINADLKKRGKQIESEDCMIAGIAQVHGETVLTRNVKHFGQIPNLRVESY